MHADDHDFEDAAQQGLAARRGTEARFARHRVPRLKLNVLGRLAMSKFVTAANMHHLREHGWALISFRQEDDLLVLAQVGAPITQPGRPLIQSLVHRIVTGCQP